MNLPAPVCRVTGTAWRGQRPADVERAIPEETAVALTYNRTTYAVMMATPADLEDFGIGFSLNEGIIASPSELVELEIVALEKGIELRMTLADRQADALLDRRRFLAGPTGCGLCGMESLDQAMRVPRAVAADLRVTGADIAAALSALPAAQALNRQTGAVHAAGYWEQGRGLVALREDVGRHNALDKLAGALTRSSLSAGHGMILLTSRVSVEMVQKAAVMGAPVVVAVSAPTALARRTAEAAGLTLVAVARADGFEVFTHPARVVMEGAASVA